MLNSPAGDCRWSEGALSNQMNPRSSWTPMPRSRKPGRPFRCYIFRLMAQWGAVLP